MMSDSRWGFGGSEMTPKNWTLEGKKLDVRGGWEVKNRQKLSDIING